MALITYLDIQDRTLDILGKNDATTRGRIKDWINMGQSDFMLRELWPFREKVGTVTTVAGTQEYLLATSMTDIDEQNIISVAIQGATNKKLPYIPYNQLRASKPDFDLDAVSVPQNYYIHELKIGFWPNPQAIYTVFVDYFNLPTAMSADGDASGVPLNYREALVHYALSLEHDFNTDPDLAVKSMNRYEQIVTLARNNLLSQPTDAESFRILGPADSASHTGLRGEVR
jgi:hypothetical protein